MATSNRRKRSPSSAAPNKKQNVRVVSEDEVFSPEIIPIKDPWEEKKIIEGCKIPYAHYLIKKLGVKSIGWTEESVHNRIREVYRICFESNDKEDMQVINDFVAFYPGLVFDTPWLAAVVHEHTVFDEPWKGSYQKRLFGALQNGFKRAAGSPLVKRRQRADWIDTQRKLMNSFERKLKEFYQSGNWNLDLSGWEEVEVPKKVDNLVKQYPPLKGASKALKAHLQKRQFREAALLIVGTLRRVNKRTLEGKSFRY